MVTTSIKTPHLTHNINSYAINCIGFIAETVKTLV
nr:MAG TPA: hypothetical protein [Herelleviridae sp.]